MGQPPQTLAALIRGAMDRRGYTSLHQLEQASGGELNRGTLSRILNGQTRTVTAPTIEALSAHLGISRRRILQATGAGAPGAVPSTPFELPTEANLLTARERRIITEMVYALLAARRVGNGTPG